MFSEWLVVLTWALGKYRASIAFLKSGVYLRIRHFVLVGGLLSCYIVLFSVVFWNKYYLNFRRIYYKIVVYLQVIKIFKLFFFFLYWYGTVKLLRTFVLIFLKHVIDNSSITDNFLILLNTNINLFLRIR